MKNSIIGLKDLRQNTESYIEKVKKGHSFVVIRKSKPVFKITPVDVWGDEGSWETVADFRDIGKTGVSLGHVLKTLERFHG